MTLRTVIFIALLITPAGCSATGQGGERTIEIKIHHSRFYPANITVAPGTTVRFVVHNLDPIDHELIVGDERVHSRHENGTERHHGSKPGEISIPALARRTTTYTFDRKETVIFGCHLPGHYDYGMRGEIVVN